MRRIVFAHAYLYLRIDISTVQIHILLIMETYSTKPCQYCIYINYSQHLRSELLEAKSLQ